MSEINQEIQAQESINDGIPQVNFTLTVSEVVQAPIDDTLSIEGMAADAKATGEAIDAAKAELQEQIDAVSGDLTAVAGILFPVGSIYVTTSASAPTFGGVNWNWKEILIPVTNDDLKNGTRSVADISETVTPGTIHFWQRIADTEVEE